MEKMFFKFGNFSIKANGSLSVVVAGLIGFSLLTLLVNKDQIHLAGGIVNAIGN